MENAMSIPHDDGSSSSAAKVDKPGHETSDATLRPIVIFVAVMFAVAVVIQVGVWGLMRIFQQHNEKSDPMASPFVDSRTPPTVTPMQPSLGHPNQPHEDMETLRERWKVELKSYGPVPGHPDQARIPLERAMQIIVEHGLPAPSSRPAGLPGGLR